jgi:adenosylhomocysteinase
VSREASNDPRRWATEVITGFAATTNLLIAGRRFSVTGGDAQSAELVRLLTAVGARETEPGERPDYLFLTGTDAAPLALDNVRKTATEPASRPLVIVDATPTGSAGADGPIRLGREIRAGVSATSIAGVFIVRPGILATTLGRGTGDSSAGRIEWAALFMPVTTALATELGASGAARDVCIGLSMVLEPKTAVLALALRNAGARVSVFAHPDETDDAVAAELERSGIRVFAKASANSAEHLALARAFLAERPQILVDDGSHLIRLAHEDDADLAGIIGAAEETTSGLRPLRIMEAQGLLRLPVVAVNDARSKTLFDNRYGTGQSCLFAILDLVDLDLAGKTVVVAGYGHVGEGVAHHARAFGARVVVAETDSTRALQATFDGHRVQRLEDAVAGADLVVSATGEPDTITLAALRACRRDAVVAVAGGAVHEIAIDAAVAAGAIRETIAPKVERFTFPGGGSAIILDNGGCINITAGEGNPIEIMDLSFGVQVSAIRHIARSKGALRVGVHPLPVDADDAVAELALTLAGITTDESAARTAPDGGWRSTRFEGGAPR